MASSHATAYADDGLWFPYSSYAPHAYDDHDDADAENEVHAPHASDAYGRR